MSGQPLEQRTYPAELVAVELRADGDGPRAVSWYPALFDSLSEDLGGFRERIGRRAFSKTLAEREVKSFVNHDPNQILGRTERGTLKVSVDVRGLRAETALPDTSYARDLIVNIDSGNISGGSFMFRATDDRWEMEDLDGVETLVRTVREAQLYEVSLVTMPAYPATEGSAQLRSVAEEWRQKLTQPAPETEEAARQAARLLEIERRKRRLNLLRLKEGKRCLR